MGQIFSVVQNAIEQDFSYRDELKKNKSYLVTLSLKVGGGQDEITLLRASKIVTRW